MYLWIREGSLFIFKQCFQYQRREKKGKLHIGVKEIMRILFWTAQIILLCLLWITFYQTCNKIKETSNMQWLPSASILKDCSDEPIGLSFLRWKILPAHNRCFKMWIEERSASACHQWPLLTRTGKHWIGRHLLPSFGICKWRFRGWFSVGLFLSDVSQIPHNQCINSQLLGLLN